MTAQQALNSVKQTWQFYSKGPIRGVVPWDTLPPVGTPLDTTQWFFDPVKYTSDLVSGAEGVLEVTTPLLCALPNTMHVNSLTAPYC